MKDLIVTGDSWSFGSEIINPTLSSDIDEISEENDYYRLNHIWPNLLKKILRFDTIKNLSFPAASNDRIFRVLYNYLFHVYIKQNKSFENLFVIVQLSSFDRKDFYIESDSENNGKWQTIWPNWEHDYDDFNTNKFSDSYSIIKSDKENLNRYVTQILHFQNFCRVYKIPYLICQGFYHTNYSPDVIEWIDEKYINLFNDNFCGRLDSINKKYYEGSSEPEMWDEIDSIRFMNKDLDNHSLHSILKLKEDSSLFYDMHPSEKGHEVIAEYIENYIKKHNLLSFN